MTEISFPVIILIAAAVLLCAIIIWRMAARSKTSKNENKFIHSVLESAVRQRTPVDLKMLSETARTGFSGLMISFSPKGILIEGPVDPNAQWDNARVEAYFRVQQEEAPVFYVFESTVREAQTEREKIKVELAMPTHLRVEQKRHFARAKPPVEDILTLAVWPVIPGKRLPASRADLDKPAVSYKHGQRDVQIKVENISGSGIGLGISAQACQNMGLDCKKGRQIIFLLVFKPESNAPKPVIFWCTAEIMNLRESPQFLQLGLEFTNWAIQEEGNAEIHWIHNSPWRGVRPILQWVSSIEAAHLSPGAGA